MILLFKQQGNAFLMLVTPGACISVIATVDVAVRNTKKVSKAASSPTSACSWDGIRAKGICRNSPTGTMTIVWQGAANRWRNIASGSKCKGIPW